MEMASAAIIEACYRVLLGREAENELVIIEAMRHPPSNVVDGFLTSDEFGSQIASAWDASGSELPTTKIQESDLETILEHLPLEPTRKQQLRESLDRNLMIRSIVASAHLRGRLPYLESLRGLEFRRKAKPYFDLSFISKECGLKFDSVEAAIEEYLSRPLEQRFRPCAAFSPALYYVINPDVRPNETDALMHYLTTGIDDRRQPHPLFDEGYVLSKVSGERVAHDVFGSFLAGAINTSCHILIDKTMIGSQTGLALSGKDAFLMVCDERASLSVSPNPVFVPSIYRASCQDRHFENELIDYCVFKRSGATISHVFDQQYYVAGLAGGTQGLTPAEHYLKFWQMWPADLSVMVDVKYLNHQLSLLGKPSEQEPLQYIVLNRIKSSGALLHPHIHSPTLRHCFQNIPESTESNDVARLNDVLEKTLWRVASREHAEPITLSIVILNYFKPAYTMLSVVAALNATASMSVEILVIENGGELLQLEAALRLFSNVKTVRFAKMDENKFFGEGNNIGVDLTDGKYVLFLNNDCMLFSSFATGFGEFFLEYPDCDVLGGLLLFPDLTIQEFGGLVSECGQVIQKYKHLPHHYMNSVANEEETDYSSAAFLVVSRKALSVVAGFDPHFEPFYYEDTDLCQRLRRAGFAIYVSKRLRAVHFENASTREFLDGNKFSAMISDHKAKFARRWLLEQGVGSYSDHSVVPSVDFTPQVTKVAVLFTPFHILAGGGERYFFTAAQALSRTHRIIICTEKIVSMARVRFTLHSLGIQKFNFELMNQTALFGRSVDVDVFFVIANEIAPRVPAIGRVNLYHLQFPFPWRNAGVFNFSELSRYDRIIVNSDYTKQWTQHRLQQVGMRQTPSIEIVYPPVRVVSDAEVVRDARDDTVVLVNVGRFFVGGHSKRQDVFIEIVKRLRLLTSKRVTGVLIGSVHPSDDAMRFLDAVKASAEKAQDIRIIIDASQLELEHVLKHSHFYVHCAGYQIQPDVQPEAAEHFGISIVEAIYAGCMPVVYDLGGPSEILRNINYGIRYLSVEDAAQKMAQVIHDRSEAKLRERANFAWLQNVNEQAFGNRLNEVIADVVAKKKAAGFSTRGNMAACSSLSTDIVEPAVGDVTRILGGVEY